MDTKEGSQHIPFLGQGWSFPPTFSKAVGGMKLESGGNDIRDSLEILLSTLPGERKMNPEYGCDLTPLLFESLTLSLRKRMSEKIKDSILRFEPRILIEQVSFDMTAVPRSSEVRLEYQEQDLLREMMKDVYAGHDENYFYPYEPGKSRPRAGQNNATGGNGGHGDGVIYINVQYLIRRTNTRHNLVYPFYLKEATNI